jgi:hypothetical protein
MGSPGFSASCGDTGKPPCDVVHNTSTTCFTLITGCQGLALVHFSAQRQYFSWVTVRFQQRLTRSMGHNSSHIGHKMFTAQNSFG